MTHIYTPFELGVFAYGHGHSCETNPFKILTPDWEQWRSGWLYCHSRNIDADLV